MTLAAGTSLGPYRIVCPLGQGGMGEVYRAHDPRLGRDVALKVLPDSMASDADCLARFTREARALAALNHPHIVTIFSTEDAPSTGSGQPLIRFLTMELVEGRTLDQVIPAGGVSMAKFFDVATAPRRRARGRAPAPNHPSRPEARQRDGGRRRTREGSRLRFVARRRPGRHSGRRRHAHAVDRDGHHSRNPAVHVPRADRGAAARQPQRPLLAGHRALRDGDRHASVSGRDFRIVDVVDHEGSPESDRRASIRHARRCRADHHPLPREAPARSYSERP